MTSPTGVDVLVITALQEEYDAVRTLIGEARWREHGTGSQAPYLRTAYHGLTVALARPVRMGGRSTAPLVTTLTDRLRPRCLAMCGVCAGHPDETAPGDVVVAAPAYEWDEGKHTNGVFRPDPQQFPLESRWERAAQDFRPDDLPSHGTATADEADVWYLERLFRGRDARKHPARERYFPRGAWAAGLERMQSAGLISVRGAEWVLTGTGREHIERTLYLDADGPDRLPYAVHAGPMASGSAVMAAPETWTWLRGGHRRVLAVEMEAATVATVAYERQVPHWLVAKGVMDHADSHKDDRFKRFAARASAEVLFALLARLLPPETPARPPGPAREIPAAIRLEVVRRLAYDWPDLADLVGVPPSETRRFRPGDEPRDLWEWLAGRDRLSDLPGALDDLGRADLASLLRPYA